MDITTAEDTTATPQTKYIVKVLTKADEDLEDDNDVFATQQYWTQNVYITRQIGRYLKSKAKQEKESRFKSEHTYYICFDSIIFFLRFKNFQFGYFLVLQSKIEENKIKQV